MAIFENPNNPTQPKSGVYGWFIRKKDRKPKAIYIGEAGKRRSILSKGTLFRGVSELQRNTFRQSYRDYDVLDTDFIVGTAILFFENNGYQCLWKHLADDPDYENKLVVEYNPVLQNNENARIKENLKIRKPPGYWRNRTNSHGIKEAEKNIFSVLERISLNLGFRNDA